MSKQGDSPDCSCVGGFESLKGGEAVIYTGNPVEPGRQPGATFTY